MMHQRGVMRRGLMCARRAVWTSDTVSVRRMVPLQNIASLQTFSFSTVPTTNGETVLPPIEPMDGEETFVPAGRPGAKKTIIMRKRGMIGRHKKYMFLLRMVSGLSTRSALARLQFEKEVRSKFLALLLTRAARRFSAEHHPLCGFDTTVKVARADKGTHTKKLDMRTPKVRMGLMRSWQSNITFILEEGLPPVPEKKSNKIGAKIGELKRKGLPEPTPALPWQPAGRHGYRDTRIKAWKMNWASKTGGKS